MKIDMTMDGMWGSCGKGGVSGWLAKRVPYDSVVCAYGTQAGHSYNDQDRGIKMVVQQLPVGVTGPTVKRIFIGPGSLIHERTMYDEIIKYMRPDQELYIHEHAAVVTDEHSRREYERGQTKMGSTAKGVGQAMVDRILRDPDSLAVAKLGFEGGPLEKYVVDRLTYMEKIGESKHLLVEGAQGFGLSLYHGEWPYCTSRDVTPWQIAADCGLPFGCAPLIRVFMVYRTYPIRVNNRDGSSGPAYPGQKELDWADIGVEPERTTVTKLTRRVFEFSELQVRHAHWHCSSSFSTVNVLTFADYCDMTKLNEIIGKIPHGVQMLCFGPDDKDMKPVEKDIV